MPSETPYPCNYVNCPKVEEVAKKLPPGGFSVEECGTCDRTAAISPGRNNDSVQIINDEKNPKKS